MPRAALMSTAAAAAVLAFQVLKIGAGGWITRIDIAPDGVQACRTDTYGGYGLPDAASPWVQFVTVDTMPAGHHGHDGAGELIGPAGVYDLSVRDENPDTGAEFGIAGPKKRTKLLTFNGLSKTETRAARSATSTG